MLLKIRLLRILFFHLFSSKDSNATQAVETRFWITPFDLELTVTAASTYGVFRMLAAWDFMFKKVSIRELRRNKRTAFAYSETIRFIKATKLFDRVRVVTKPLYWDKKMFYMQHKYFVGDSLRAIAISRAAAWGEGGVISPSELIPQLGDFEGPVPELINHLNNMNDSMNKL